MAEPILAADGVDYAIAGRRLVEGASLALHPGELTVLVGPNGAGKSTLLRLMSGELSPAGGTVCFGAELLAAMPPWRLACRRAVMAQQTRLAFPFDVWSVARLGCEGVGRSLPRAARDGIVARALDRAGIGGLATRDYQTLSGGEQQRVQFARALCQLEAGASLGESQVLFLDEPVASLDLCHQLALLDHARAVAGRGVAVLVVLHDLNLALTYADRLVVMAGGRIVATGPAATTLDDAILSGVFNVSLRLGLAPPAPMPFLLPQQIRASHRSS